MLRCKICRRSVRNTVLIVINNKSYCKRCLSRIKTRDTNEYGSYYINVGPRIFIEFPDRISEYRLHEVKVGAK